MIRILKLLGYMLAILVLVVVVHGVFFELPPPVRDVTIPVEPR